MHLEKLFWQKLCTYKKFVGGNYLAISGRIASRYQRRKMEMETSKMEMFAKIVKG